MEPSVPSSATTNENTCSGCLFISWQMSWKFAHKVLRTTQGHIAMPGALVGNGDLTIKWGNRDHRLLVENFVTFKWAIHFFYYVSTSDKLNDMFQTTLTRCWGRCRLWGYIILYLNFHSFYNTFNIRECSVVYIQHGQSTKKNSLFQSKGPTVWTKGWLSKTSMSHPLP